MVVDVPPVLPGALEPEIELRGSYVEIEFGPTVVGSFGGVGEVITLPRGGVLGPVFWL